MLSIIKLACDFDAEWGCWHILWKISHRDHSFSVYIVVILIVNILFRFTHKYSLQYLFLLTLFMATEMKIRSIDLHFWSGYHEFCLSSDNLWLIWQFHNPSDLKNSMRKTKLKIMI